MNKMFFLLSLFFYNISVKADYKAIGRALSQSCNEDYTEDLSSNASTSIYDDPEMKALFQNEDLSPAQLRERLGSLLEDVYDENALLINKNLVRDLDLIIGSNNQKDSVLNQIKQKGVTTVSGELFLAKLLCSPTSSIELLTKRQAIIQGFIEMNDADKKELTKAFALIHAGEGSLMQCFPELPARFANKIGKGEKSKTFQLLEKFSYAIGKSPKINHVLMLSGSSLTPAFLAYKLKPFIYDYAYLTASDSSEFLLKRLYAGVLGGSSVGVICTIFYLLKKHSYEKGVLPNYKKLIGISKIVRGLEKIDKVLLKNKDLRDKLEFFKNIRALFDNSTNNSLVSSDLKRLKNLLLTRTFKGSPSYIHYEGRRGAVDAILNKVKKELLPILHAAGEVDAYNTCAILYTNFKDSSTPYSFVNYKTSSRPYINAQNIWHPLVSAVNPSAVVLNSIEIGGSVSSNAIITGPNAGGKSTFLKSLAFSVLCAQTIGMAPTSFMELTVFEKINTYINITDDTAQAKSLFVAEVERAQFLLNSISSLKSSEFSFSIMDEMFTGTAAKEGEAATYAIARNFSKNKNSIVLLATHFKKLQELEKEKSGFKNYQVKVIHHADGSFSYPYKLEEGCSNQNVAFDILLNKGFEGSIVNDARALLNT